MFKNVWHRLPVCHRLDIPTYCHVTNLVGLMDSDCNCKWENFNKIDKTETFKPSSAKRLNSNKKYGPRIRKLKAAQQQCRYQKDTDIENQKP